MSFFSAVSAAIAVTFLLLIIKEIKPELVLPISIAFSVIIFSGLIEPIKSAFQTAGLIAKTAGIDNTLLSGAIKIIGMAITAELISSLLRDAGQTSAAEKVELCAKVSILTLTLPVITELCTAVFEIL